MPSPIRKMTLKIFNSPAWKKARNRVFFPSSYREGGKNATESLAGILRDAAKTNLARAFISRRFCVISCAAVSCFFQF
ncbi:hypothetical protein [Candidatus Electronema sp. JM]|uniref:hypothetical protein n=1 Tax=Candidatus Electronema sp. JM TaxID=3401571 RepID=UPI003AA89637